MINDVHVNMKHLNDSYFNLFLLMSNNNEREVNDMRDC